MFEQLHFRKYLESKHNFLILNCFLFHLYLFLYGGNNIVENGKYSKIDRIGGVILQTSSLEKSADCKLDLKMRIIVKMSLKQINVFFSNISSISSIQIKILGIREVTDTELVSFLVNIFKRST